MFGEAVNPSETFARLKIDGLFGLGFKELAASGAESPIDNMKIQKLIKKRVFSIRMNRDDASTGGELIIGGVAKDLFEPPMQYVPILLGGFWRISIDHITETSNTIDICPNGCTAILDSGTSLIAGSSDVVNRINKQILKATYDKETKSYVLDCSRLAHMPDITITIQGKPYVLTPNDYVLTVRTARFK